MILRRLQLHPFAGTVDRELRFEPGLNVVLGPNEAGKSTMRRAIRQALLVPTKLGKREAEGEVLPYLPLGGGDTIRVSLDLAEGENVWRLSKRWSPGNSASELTLPDGGLVTDGPAVEEALGQILGLTRGTWDHALFSAQGEIGKSLDRLAEGGDLGELNERLRRAVFETDGVSLEKLSALLEARYKAAYDRWDVDLNRPEGNRGLDQRWMRGAGSIVTAWYEREAARIAFEEAEQYYRRLDALNAKVHRAHRQNTHLAEWIATHEKVARDAELRLQLEAELAGVESRGKGLKEVSQEWPVVANRVQEQETLLSQAKDKLVHLGQELARAKAWESAEKTRRLLEDAAKIQTALDAAKAELSALGKIDPAAPPRIEAIERERDRLHTRLEAARLRVRLTAVRSWRVETRSGVDAPLPREIAAGEEVNFEAGGRVSLRDPEGAWEIEVSSAEIDLAADETRLRELSDEMTSLLASLGVEDPAAARQKHAGATGIAQRIALHERQLADLLGSRTLGEWQAECDRLSGGEAAPTRPLGEVAADNARTESEINTATREIAALRQKLAAWERDFFSADELLDRLADLRASHKAVKQKIEALHPLPEGTPDAASFLHDFRTKRSELEQHRGELHQLLLEKAELVATAPAFEPADAMERLDLANAALTRARREGETIRRIRREYEQLRAELDADTLAPWHTHLAEVLAPLTRDRYRGLTPDLSKAARADATAIPFAALSAGTRASLGLALRLSMARWFLEGRDGFLLLDDPFVDLDPDRQADAAALLRHFAADKQVVLFTCHPAHATLLGGHRIEL